MSAPAQSTSPVAFMPAIAAKIATATSLTCKIIDWNTIRGPFTETFLQEGVAIALGRLKHRNIVQGAGQKGYLANRDLIVRTTTINHSDPAGRQEIALAEHWALEDVIESVLVVGLITPLIFPLQGIDLDGEKWDGINNVDEGRFTSFMGFSILYPLPLSNAC